MRGPPAWDNITASGRCPAVTVTVTVTVTVRRSPSQRSSCPAAARATGTLTMVTLPAGAASLAGTDGGRRRFKPGPRRLNSHRRAMSGDSGSSFRVFKLSVPEPWHSSLRPGFGITAIFELQVACAMLSRPGADVTLGGNLTKKSRSH